MERDPNYNSKGRAIWWVGFWASTLIHGPCTTVPGPLLQRREIRLTDGFPVTRLVLFEQSVAHQKPKAAFTDLDRRGARGGVVHGRWKVR